MLPVFTTNSFGDKWIAATLVEIREEIAVVQPEGHDFYLLRNVNEIKVTDPRAEINFNK